MKTIVEEVLNQYQNDRSRLMDILIDTQKKLGYLSDDTLKEIAEKLNISFVDVEQTASFYHFFKRKPSGEYTVYLNNSVTAVMNGMEEIAKVFESEVGCKFGEVSPDGKIGLFYTPCIGMCDQEPSAIINGKVFTRLSPSFVKDLVAKMKKGIPVEEMIPVYGDGNNSHPDIKAMVNNNIRKEGKVIFSEYEVGTALRKAVEMTPAEVISVVKDSNIRGRGGAGFPTGLKWEYCSKANSDEKYVICNADEGEPGTFKDRVLLTEKAQMVFEGMAICGYAIGAKKGIIYLRAEYEYLKKFLENQLEELRNKSLLRNILGKFDFDIRIQFGSGAYVCGEESALIESAEGKRGEPRNRPPFPVEYGYMGKPTVVNNVETFCSITRIIEKGAEWYRSMGTKDSSGTKLLSISGDVKHPGVYEVEWGMSIRKMLEMAGAEKVQAVQVAGPSGILIGPDMFDRKIAYEDLPTGGSMIVIGEGRNLLKDVVLNFMEFFVEESCGSCTPCRALNVILKEKLEKIIHGKGIRKDIDELKEWGSVLKITNRCGLGQTSANPILSSIANFRHKYEELVSDVEYLSEFNLEESVKESCKVVGRTPKIH